MVAVLFARRDSIYKQFQDCDVYDIDRDALTFPGGLPVVAHPPCRAWGRLRHMANPRPGEKDLAFFAIDMVRKFGGVLEHPVGSTLWPAANLPTGPWIDEHGGYTLSIDQFWWGHRARKKTWLYICGVSRAEVPPMPLKFGEATHTIGSCVKLKNRPWVRRPEVTKAEREHTPPDLARWLVDLAKLTNISITT